MVRKNIDDEALFPDFFGPNQGYMIEQFDKYQQDPASVDEGMRQYFAQIIEMGTNDGMKEINHLGQEVQIGEPQKLLQIIKLADSIRTSGHLAANIYPLKDHQPDIKPIDLKNFGLTEADLKKYPAHLLSQNVPPEVSNALEAYRYLVSIYTESIAYEFHHVHNEKEKNWLIDWVEHKSAGINFPSEKRKEILSRLMEVEEFERFLHKTFVGQKRFSIEGLDMMIPMMDEMISEAVHDGAQFVNIGMAHRGRLNVLAHILGKPYEMIFAEFQHAPNKELVPSEGSIGINFGWTGDVKYHLGLNRKITGGHDGTVKLTLANNPSHLEFVGPVVEGYTRAAQDDRSKPGLPTQNYNAAFSILIHGDAAFPGEGIVAETLNLSRLKGYRTGGTIHIIANNTIGFTTESEDSRSTRYASDLAKGFEIPIVHVNADDPEACLKAALLAVEYRSVFEKDFLIDLIGYRRFGHNEMDEPMATNPGIYSIIPTHPTVKELYLESLKKEGAIGEEAQKINASIVDKLKNALEKVQKIKKDELLKVPEPPAVQREEAEIDSSVTLEKLRELNKKLLEWPTEFKVFPKLEKILKRRVDALDEGGKVDWALAETLSFASIITDGTPIRLTGQDTERGTFAHRNLVLHDVQTGRTFSPLHLLSTAKASFAIHNSPLTESAVVGFEYGYNVFAPETLVIWEAQFGDFANVAQVIFDQFIAAGRAKWGQKSGMVMLLPHGYEGQGPEHSSGRVERFLQSAAEKNWTVANLTTSAQYFHILRRQAAMLGKEEVRPLIIMTPKSLLRNPMVSSSGKDLSEGRFQPVLEHFSAARDTSKIERIVLCSGKIAIDLAELMKNESDYDWLQVLRVEEIYPFPTRILREKLSQFKNIQEIYWVQEEPKNMGAWNFVEPRINEIAPNGIKAKYIGRRRRSSPAEGDPTIHKLDQSKILHAAITKLDEGGQSNG